MSEKNFVMPMSGELLSLTQVPDENFSRGLLGEGFAVRLSGEVVISPFSGVVIAAFPSGHAFIIRRNDGLEVLIHIGLNSAAKADAFRLRIAKYDEVKQGDVLVYVDTKKLAEQESDLISPVVFANPDIKIELHKPNQIVAVGDDNAVSLA